MSQRLKAPAKGSKATQRRRERTLLSAVQIIITLHPPPSRNTALKLKFLRLKELIQDNEHLRAKKKMDSQEYCFFKFYFSGVVDFKDNIIEIHK